MLAVVARAAKERGLDNVTTQQGAVESLPFEDGSFDVVLSRFSAHHWRDFDAGLREAARVVKAGGMVAMVDTVSSGIPLFPGDRAPARLLPCPQLFAGGMGGCHRPRRAGSRLGKPFPPAA
jgi:ubiquinone/menaquinone biosynthesis C-methylase UbiE